MRLVVRMKHGDLRRPMGGNGYNQMMREMGEEGTLGLIFFNKMPLNSFLLNLKMPKSCSHFYNLGLYPKTENKVHTQMGFSLVGPQKREKKQEMKTKNNLFLFSFLVKRILKLKAVNVYYVMGFRHS